MFQLAMDLPSCESLGPGPDFRLLPRPSQRPPRLWSLKSGQAARVPVPVWSPRPARVERSHGQMPSPRAKRAHRPRDQVAALVPRGGLAKPPAAARPSPSLGSSSSPSPTAGSAAGSELQALLRRGKRHVQGPGFNSFDFRGGRPTTETEFIAWGPTGEEEAPESNTFPGLYGPTTASVSQTRKTTVAIATTAAPGPTAASVTLQTKGAAEPLGPRDRIPVGVSTTDPPTSPSKDNGEDVKPPRILGETSGTPTSFLVGARSVREGGHPGGVASEGCPALPGGHDSAGLPASQRRNRKQWQSVDRRRPWGEGGMCVHAGTCVPCRSGLCCSHAALLGEGGW